MRKRSMPAGLLFILNILFFCAFLAALIFPVGRKKAMYVNTDISSFENVEDIPLVGAVTNDRKALLRFSLYGEELYGICLYFYAEGMSTEGELRSILRFGDKTVDEQVIPVRELISLTGDAGVQTKELLFDGIGERSGEYTLELAGNGIPADTRISFYGNNSTERYLSYEDGSVLDYYSILYIVEVCQEERPYIWATAFIFVMSMVITCIMYMNRERT